MGQRRSRISPATAERLDLDNGDIVEITHEGRRLRVPVWISPGHAADAITVHVGYGRLPAGRVGNATGVNVYVLRGSARAVVWRRRHPRRPATPISS